MAWRVMVAACGLAAAARASALQPLEVFLRGARTSNPDAAEARAGTRQAGAEAVSALGRALPRISLRGAYVRNQSETTLQLPGPGGAPSTVTITPRDRFDGTATLDVPLVDLASFARVAAARTGARASAEAEVATGLQVQAAVAQDYYQLVANAALVRSTRNALDVARTTLRIAEQRRDAGAGTLLDVDRARAEVERDVQQLAAAELQVALVARDLGSRTGVAPELQGEVSLQDDLHEEPPLERFERPDPELPALASAIQGRLAAEQLATAQRLALVPSLAATAIGQTTSAAGLGGRDTSWAATVGLTWSFDLTSISEIRARDAAADAARAREDRARLAARDDIHRAWSTVRTGIARSRSARVAAEVSARAAGLALDRYQAGTATQLDLLQAQRDALAADAARIQADADLVNARAQLRVAAGTDLLRSGGQEAP